MESNQNIYAEVDENGHLVLPPEVVSHHRIKPGDKILLKDDENGLHLSSPARLAKLYIEPTNRCNLDCRTCIRNVWDEPPGLMSGAVFDRIVEGLKAFSPAPTIFFGGFGEPLLHPDIIEMLTRVKDLGARIELITNGTLLTPELSNQLLGSGLDMLWISLDGATPQSYADIRLGAELPHIIENLSNFNQALNSYGGEAYPAFLGKNRTKLGVEFVATKSNIADLPGILSLARQFSAQRLIVTNVLPYTKEMCGEMLYTPVTGYQGSLNVSMARIDGDNIIQNALSRATSVFDVNVFNSNSDNQVNRCPFIRSGSGAIGWDGSLSPCLALLHSHTSYTPYHKRFSRRWAIGNILERDLSDLWEAKEHLAFREKVQSFNFPPCTFCSGCDLLDGNEEDCYGNAFPTCGGCLWSQGLIRCP